MTAWREHFQTLLLEHMTFRDKMTNKKIRGIALFLIIVMLMSTIDSAVVFAQVSGSSDLNRPTFGDISSQIPGQNMNLQNREYSPIVIQVDNYEPTVLTDNLLGEGRIVPVFVNLKGYSIDPNLEPLIKNGRVFVKDVKSKPEHANAKSLFIAGTRYFPPEIPGLDDLGFVVVYLKPLPREHLPLEDTITFSDLPKFKKDEIIGILGDTLNNISEIETIKILNDQAKSLILKSKDDAWTKLIPRKNAFLEELTIEMGADLGYDLNTGFGITQEDIVLDINDNKKLFWKGQGAIGLGDISANSATFSVFAGRNRLIQNNIQLQEGGTSQVLSLRPGFGILSNNLGNFKIQLTDIRDKGDRAIFNINGDKVVLSKGEQLYSGSFWIIDEITSENFFDDQSGQLIVRQKVVLKNKKTLERKELIKESVGAARVTETTIPATADNNLTRPDIGSIAGADDNIANNVKNKWGTTVDNAIKDIKSPTTSVNRALTKELVMGVIAVESRGIEDVGSKTGCLGLMQFCSSTAFQYNLCNNANCDDLDERTNGEKSINAGIKYLNVLLNRYEGKNEKINFALASYNGGEGTIDKAIINTGIDNPTWEQVKEKINVDLLNSISFYRNSPYFNTDGKKQNKVNEIISYPTKINSYASYYKSSNIMITEVNANAGANRNTGNNANTVTGAITLRKIESLNDGSINNFNDVIQEYRRIIEQYPDEKDSYGSDAKGNQIAAKSLYRTGRIYEDLGINSEAAFYYRKLLHDYPDYAAAIPVTEQGIQEIELMGNWDVSRASFSDDRVSVTLENIDQVKPDQNANAKISIRQTTNDVPIASLYHFNDDIENTEYKVNKILEDSVELVQKNYPYRPLELKKGADITINGVDNTRFIARLIEINAKSSKEAKVMIIPNSNLARSSTEFTIHLPIEKRGIQLSPEKIESNIKRAEDIAKKLHTISGKIDTIITWLSKICFVLGTYYTIKNGFGAKNRLIARENVVQSYLNNQCANEADKIGCLQKNQNDIEESVKKVTENLDKFSEYRKNVGKIAPNDVNKQESIRAYREDLLKQAGVIGVEGQDIVLGNEKINENALRDLSDQEIQDLLSNSMTNEVSKHNFAERLKQINSNQEKVKTIKSDLVANKQSLRLDDNLINAMSDEQILAFDRSRVVQSNSVYYVDQITKTGNLYTVLDLNGKPVPATNYNPVTRTANADVNSDNKIDQISIRNIVDRDGFGNYISNKQIRVDNCKITAIPYPYNGNEGNYLEIQPGDYTLNNEPMRIVVINAGDGVMMNDRSDKIVVVFTNPNDPEYIAAANFIRPKNFDLVKNCNAKNLRIGSEDIKVLTGNAVNKQSQQCEFFMSIPECKTLYTFCDPVVCPSSRFDLKGKVYIDNPIQTGIVGSAILGLPRGTVCLTGISAGLKNLESTFNAYGQCLKTARDQDRSVGLCDKITGVYLCEFVWKNIAPLVTSGAIFDVKHIFTGGTGDNNGGEYLDFADNYKNAKDTASFFVNDYAKNSLTVFRAYDVNDVGTTICRRAIFSSVPGGDIFNKLGKPENPVQYTAWFDEKVYSTKRVKTSAYSIFYHVYAGDNNIDLFNRGFIEYSIFLQDPELGINYITNPQKKRLNSGEAAVENIDLVLPSGYSKICIQINQNPPNCNFGKVSTDFGLNILSDYVASSQALKNIETSEQCTSTYSEGYKEGQTSIYAYNAVRGSGAFSGDVVTSRQSRREAGTDYNYAEQKFGAFSNGIERKCGALNPGKGTGREEDWKVVGSCGIDKISGADAGSCWINLQSIKDSISADFLEEKAVEDIQTISKGKPDEFERIIQARTVDTENIKKDFGDISTAKNLISIAELKLLKGRENFISYFKRESPSVVDFLNEDDIKRLKETLDETDGKLANLNIVTDSGQAEVRYLRNEINEMKLWIDREITILKTKSINCDLDIINVCQELVVKDGLNEFMVKFENEKYFMTVINENGQIKTVKFNDVVIASGSVAFDKEYVYDIDKDGNNDFKYKFVRGSIKLIVSRSNPITLTDNNGNIQEPNNNQGTQQDNSSGINPNEIRGTINGKCKKEDNGYLWTCSGFSKDEEFVIKDFIFVFNEPDTGVYTNPFDVPILQPDQPTSVLVGPQDLSFNVFYSDDKVDIGCGKPFKTPAEVSKRSFVECPGFKALAIRTDEKPNRDSGEYFTIKFDVYEGNFEFEHIGEGIPRLSFKFFNGKWQWKTIGKTEYADILDDIDYTKLLNSNGYEVINKLKKKDFKQGINSFLEFIRRNDYFKDNNLEIKYKSSSLINFEHGSDKLDNLKALTKSFKNLYDFGVLAIPTNAQTFKDKISETFSNTDPTKIEFEYEEDAFFDEPNIIFKFENGQWVWSTKGLNGYKSVTEYIDQLIKDDSYKDIFNKMSKEKNNFLNGVLILLNNIQNGQDSSDDDEIILINVNTRGSTLRIEHGQVKFGEIKKFIENIGLLLITTTTLNPIQNNPSDVLTTAGDAVAALNLNSREECSTASGSVIYDPGLLTGRQVQEACPIISIDDDCKNQIIDLSNGASMYDDLNKKCAYTNSDDLFTIIDNIQDSGNKINGKASFYPEKLEGRPVACGNKLKNKNFKFFSNNQLTAAVNSKEFGCGATLQVSYIDQESDALRSVDVTVTDKGPFELRKGRLVPHGNVIIDLSKEAFCILLYDMDYKNKNYKPGDCLSNPGRRKTIEEKGILQNVQVKNKNIENVGKPFEIKAEYFKKD